MFESNVLWFGLGFIGMLVSASVGWAMCYFAMRVSGKVERPFNPGPQPASKLGPWEEAMTDEDSM